MCVCVCVCVLGTVTTIQEGDWKAHVLSAIARAKRRSNDLAYMCRDDCGVRPRTAVTLWQSLVRPVLEYASEIWSGQPAVPHAEG